MANPRRDMPVRAELDRITGISADRRASLPLVGRVLGRAFGAALDLWDGTRAVFGRGMRTGSATSRWVTDEFRTPSSSERRVRVRGVT